MAASSPEHLNPIKQDYHQLRLKYEQLRLKRQSVASLEQQCKSQVANLITSLGNLSGEDAVADDVRSMRGGVHEISSTLPQPSTLFLRLILGDISATIPSRDDKVLYKQNYEKFKMVHVTTMCILGVVSLIFSEYTLPSALVHLVSVWYYFTVTLRELILLTNGSKIKWWWLTHHYFSIIIAALLLIWPPGACYSAFKGQFMLFTCSMSVVMALQFRYQKAKLYRQVAMGEKHHMSVSQEGKLSKMTVLLACLLGIYLFQLFNAFTLMRLYLSEEVDCSHWQVPVLSVLFLTVACMNCSTLSTVIYGKSKPKGKRQ